MPEPPSTREHKRSSPRSLRVAIITCSTSRHQKHVRGEKYDDASGDLLVNELTSAGHKIVERELIPDDRRRLREALIRICGRTDVDALIVSGGTGIAPRDVTIEVVGEHLGKRIDGFGELFRYLSYLEIGSAAMLSRAIAGVYLRKPVICLPGSLDATRLALTRLIIPEIGHLVKHAREQ